MSLNSIINQINNLTGYNIPSASGVIISSSQQVGSGSVNNIINYINGITGYNVPNTNVQYVSGSNVSGPIVIYTPFSSGDTISTEGILPGRIIRAEHVLRIIYALSGITENTIIVSGSFLTSGSNVLNGTLSLPFIDDQRFLYVSGGYVVGVDLPPSSSYAISSSYSISSSFAQSTISSSYSISSSFATDALTASYFTGSISNADFAITASHALSGNGSFSGSFSGSLYGTSSWAESASFALTASYALNIPVIDLSGYTTTASFDAFTSSYYQDSASFDQRINNITFDTSSLVTTASFNAFTASYNTGSFTGSFVGTLEGTASWAESALTASYLNPLNQNIYITGSVFLKGTASIDVLNVTYVSSSIIYSSGSNQLGDSTNDTQTLIGAVIVSGSQQVTGALHAPSVTGSLYGTASWAKNAQTASNILGGKAPHVPFFITDTTLATSSIYQSGSSTVIINQDAATEANPEALYVWQPSTSSFNVISGKGNLDNYLQLNIQNTNQGPDASSDIVATANNGNESVNYIDMGINSENYAGFLGGPNDAYLYSAGENLWIGNYSDGKNVYFFNSSSEDALITLTPSNTVDIGTTLNAPDITGSLEGTASWAKNVISASHAVNSDFAGYAQLAGIAANGGVTQLIAGSGITLLPGTGVGNVTVIAGGGGGGITIITGSNVTESFANSTTWNFVHNLGTKTPVISVFDSNYNQVIPESIQLVDLTSSIITFPTPESGFAVATVGGVSGTALSASYALFSTYADTASFYAETDPVFVARSASLATTGSNSFIGTQRVSGSIIVTGSVIISGSSTFTNIGPAIFTGSLNVSGSTTQTGNNTLIGNTVLSGSINISGSQMFNGTSEFYGNHTLSGSNTITGNTVLSGSITVSGSSDFKNSLFIVTGSAFFKGIHQVSGSTSITGSFNVRDGDINIVSGSSFTRWGNKLFNYGQFSDTTTQSGSANTAYAMKFNTTDFALNTRIVSESRITVDNTGLYNLQFSAQLGNTANTAIDFDIWFAYTGSNIPNSNTHLTLNKVPGTLGRLVAAWNLATPIQAGDYVEIYWSCDAPTGQLQSAPSASAPTRPAVPSVIATLTQIA